MARHRILATALACAVLAAALLASCANDPGEPETTTLPNECAEPAWPSCPASGIVGDGAPESCTESALRAALDDNTCVAFDCGPDPVTIPLSAKLAATGETIIDGGGLVTLDGGGATRIFSSVQENTIAFKGLGFANGYAAGEDGYGGAILGGWRTQIWVNDCTFTDNRSDQLGGAIFAGSDGALTIGHSTFTGNTAPYGGAIHDMLSPLTIVDTVFDGNTATTYGGGAIATDGASGSIDDGEGGVISLCGCTFSNNEGAVEGGGVYLFAYPPDVLEVNRCLFENNAAFALDGSALGGGLRTGNAKLTLANSAFVGNTAASHGGGLWVDGSRISTITNCTFAGNSSGGAGFEAGYGGAISGGNLLMTNLTIVGNTAGASGGAIFNEDEVSILRNSVLADNTAENEWGISLSCRSPIDGADNIQWPDQGEEELCTSGTTYADPALAPLADNGGATPTMAPDGGSPLLSAALDHCPPDDQRGEPRLTPCDVGALEIP